MLRNDPSRALWISLVVGAALCLHGCAGPESTGMAGPNATGTVRISEAELQNELHEYTDRFSGIVSAAANEITANSPDRTARKAALLWKIRLIPRLQDMVFGNDPQEAYLDAATLTVQMRKYLQGPDTPGATIFADLQPTATSAAQLLEDDIFRIGGQFLSPEQLDTLRAEVDTFTNEHPIRGTFSLAEGRATSTKEAQAINLNWVTTIPMAPFRALEGIDAGAQAIREFNTTANQFAQIVEDMPQQTRWQIELLWYELEDRETFLTALNSFKTLAESSTALSQAAEQLPQQVREQLTLAMDDLESRQEALSQTLAETRQTVDALNDAVSNTTVMVGAVNEASASVAEAGEAWHQTVAAINELTQADASAGSATEAQPFDIKEYTQAAEQLTTAATELRSLVAEVQGVIESERISALSDSTLEDAEQRGRRVTDHVAWRALQLMAVAFVLMLIYRVISGRMAKQQTTQPN